MSDEPLFVTDPGFGEFIVSASGYYDHNAGIWWKPWTDKPDRAVIGYVGHRHPSEEPVLYSYLVIDLESGSVVWYFGSYGTPAQDRVIGRVRYRD